MQSVYQIIQDLRATSSKNAKLAILEANKDNEDIKKFLRVTYEPRINFYVTSVDPKLAPMSMVVLTQQRFTSEMLDNVYATLAERQLTGGGAKRWLSALYNELDSEGQELLRLMIQRDVQAGISDGTINTVWPGLVTDPPYMRCSLPKEAKLGTWPWAQGIYSQIKADGQYASISHYTDDSVSIESRAGSPMPLDHFQGLVSEIKKSIPKGWQIHGELLMIDPSGNIMPREEGNGLFNSLLKEGDLPDGYTPIYHAWDIIPVSEAKAKNKYKIPYKERLSLLEASLEGTDLKHLELIEYKIVYSLREAYQHAKEAMDRGLEGTVVKHPEMIWEDNTSKFQVKLKLEFTVELRVKGLKPAAKKSKNAKTFGSLLCESECGLLKVAVTGLKDDKRKYIFDHFDAEYKEKIVAITANGIQFPKKGGSEFYSLFLPRFSDDRLDKKQADTLERIKEIREAAIEMLIATANL